MTNKSFFICSLNNVYYLWTLNVLKRIQDRDSVQGQVSPGAGGELGDHEVQHEPPERDVFHYTNNKDVAYQKHDNNSVLRSFEMINVF